MNLSPVRNNSSKINQSLTLLVVILVLVTLSLCTVCYVCYDSECEDAYTGDEKHAIDCSRIDGHTEDGGCSKWKSQSKQMGMTYYYGMFCLVVR